MGPTQLAVAWAVTLVWVAGCTLAFITKDPGTLSLATSITPLMLGVAGWLFARGIFSRSNGNGRNGHGKGGRKGEAEENVED